MSFHLNSDEIYNELDLIFDAKTDSLSIDAVDSVLNSFYNYIDKISFETANEEKESILKYFQKLTSTDIPLSVSSEIILFKLSCLIEHTYLLGNKSYCTDKMKHELCRYGFQSVDTIAIYGYGYFSSSFLRLYKHLIGVPASNILFIDSFVDEKSLLRCQDASYPVINVRNINSYKIDKVIFMSPKNKEVMHKNFLTYSKKRIDTMDISPFFFNAIKYYRPQIKRGIYPLIILDNTNGVHYYKKGKAEETFYIIKPFPNTGLFSLFITTIAGIAYALKNKYIAVVDMMNFTNCYLPDRLIGYENSWEYFFEQPMGKDVIDAYSAPCSIMSGVPEEMDRPNDRMSFFLNEDGVQEKWKSIVKAYVKIKPDILNQIEKEYSAMVCQDDIVLGILIRGTDYRDLKPKDHPVQPEIQMVIEDARNFVKKYSCTKIFVATEDITYIKKIKEEFKEKVISIKREYINYQRGQRTPLVHIDRENDYFLQGLEYLKQIVMLSKSDYLLAGRTSGTVGTFLLSDGFKDFKVYDLGRYK